MYQTLASAEATFDRLAELLTSPTLDEIRDHLRCLRSLAEKHTAVVWAPAPAASVFRREGDYWAITYRGRRTKLRASLGLSYLAQLLAHPGRQLPSIELAASGASAAARDLDGVGAEILDPRAVGEYRAHLRMLEGELHEAQARNDLGCCERLQAQIETIRDELGAAFGVGNRPRRFSSDSERVRLNVTRAIRAALSRIAGADPSLAEHLSRAVHTGVLCSYDPDPGAMPLWQLA